MDILSRRQFLGAGAAGIAISTTGGWRSQDKQRSGDKTLAEELTLTPRQTQGAFYPDRLPLDTDNVLLVVNVVITLAVGTITHLSGRVLDKRGSPLRGIGVEIWQC